MEQRLVKYDDIRPKENNVIDQDETFITQKAGKIIQTKNSVSKSKNVENTMLLKKKRELEAISVDLDKKRAEAMRRMEEIREQREGLKVRQRQLKERVAKFEKFLAESNAKRIRAIQKASNEKKIRMQKEVDCASFREQIEEENERNEKIMQIIKENQPYENYLQAVVKSLPLNYFNTQEHTINDILLRHKTLFETHHDLVQQIESNQRTLEELHDKLGKIMKEKDDNILVYNSVLGTKQQQYEKLQQERVSREQKQQEHYKTTKEKLRVLGETKLAIHSLYERVMMIQVLANQNDATNTAKANNNTNMESVDIMEFKLYVIREKLLDLNNLTAKALSITNKKGKQVPSKKDDGK